MRRRLIPILVLVVTGGTATERTDHMQVRVIFIKMRNAAAVAPTSGTKGAHPEERSDPLWK
jgi:hypothetical protein